MSGITIAEPGRLDARDLAEVARISVAGFENDIDLADWYRDELADPVRRLDDYRILLGRDAGAAVATVSVLRPGRRPPLPLEPDEGYLRVLAVDPDRRRRGYASAMLAVAEDLARGDGARAMVLHTSPDWIRAVSLYESRGYRRAPEREGLSLLDGEQVAYFTFVKALSR